MGMVIDSHCHIFPETFSRNRGELSSRDATFAELYASKGAVGGTGGAAGSEARMATSETLIQAMDTDAVAGAVVMGLGWTDLNLAHEANDYIIRAVETYPGRLVGFCSVDPSWGHEAVAEVERCWKAGLKGVGELHPDTQGFVLDDREVLAPLMDLAGRLAMPVLVHTSEPVGHRYPGKGRTTPGKVYRFIENFPDNVIICAHWGGGLPFYALMPEVPAVLKNVFFDTAASPFLYRPQVFSTVIGLVGPEKVLFATDFPLVKHRRALAQVEEAIPPGKDRNAVLGGNAARLFGF